MTAATIREAPVVRASDIVELLERESEPLTAVETRAIVADILRRAEQEPSPSITSARTCRCRHHWEFERGHCACCGLDLEGPAS